LLLANMALLKGQRGCINGQSVVCVFQVFMQFCRKCDIFFQCVWPFEGSFVDVRRSFGQWKGQLRIQKGQSASSCLSSMGMPIASGSLPIARLADKLKWEGSKTEGWTDRLKTRSTAKPYIRAPLPMLWAHKSRRLRQLGRNACTQ